MKKRLFLVLASLFVTGALAQTKSQEAAPPTSTKPQMTAEAKKNSKSMGVPQIKDGSTADGQGSGIKKTTRSEMKGQERQAAREAKPHQNTTQGGTPK